MNFTNTLGLSGRPEGSTRYSYTVNIRTLCVKDEWGNKLKVIIVVFLPGGVTKSLAALFFFPASVDESWDFGDPSNFLHALILSDT